MARPEATDDLTDDEDAAILAAYQALPRSKWGTETVQRDHDVLVAARARIADAYDSFDEVIVSFSAGKDSTCLMNLAAEECIRRRIRCRVMFFDEEAIPLDVEDYVRRLLPRPELDLEWLCLPVQHRNACTADEPNWWPWEPESRDLWCRDLPPEAIHEGRNPPEWWPTGAGRDNRPSIPVCSSLYAASRPGTVCFLLGLRAEESMRRRSIIRKRGGVDAHVTHQTANGTRNLWMSYPIYDWTVSDVWTAIGTFGWDYCRHYDAMELIGVPASQQRIGPPYGEEPMGSLAKFRETDPALWDKLSMRVPGARTAALYSRTTLYGYGHGGDDGGVSKPDGMTWPEAINDALSKHDPVTLGRTAPRIAMFVKSHFKKTSDPILDVPHPVSAVSWPWLYRLAVRGDVKWRREPPMSLDFDVFKRRHAAYQKALAEQQETPHR